MGHPVKNTFTGLQSFNRVKKNFQIHNDDNKNKLMRLPEAAAA